MSVCNIAKIVSDLKVVSLNSKPLAKCLAEGELKTPFTDVTNAGQTEEEISRRERRERNVQNIYHCYRSTKLDAPASKKDLSKSVEPEKLFAVRSFQ